MTEEYKKYKESNDLLKKRLAELHKQKLKAGTSGDTEEVIKITTEMIHLNRSMILNNHRLKVIMDALRNNS